ncbi:MAG: hypothetical protein ACOX0C_02125 [Patescibacteria group bacterium]|jgi:hypothetical protein
MQKTKTPLKSIRAYCLWCCNNQVGEVRSCPKTDCAFYKFRLGKKKEKGSLIKVIRAKCFDCGSGTPQSITLCEFGGCPIYPFRQGKSPAHKSAWANKPKRHSPFKNRGLIAKKNEDQGIKTSMSDLKK